MFRFRIHLIRIQQFRLNIDPDPGFWWQKIEKINNWKIAIYLFLGLHKGHPSYRISRQPSKENIHHFKKMKFVNIFLFLWVIFALLDPDTYPLNWLNLDPIRIRNTACYLSFHDSNEDDLVQVGEGGEAEAWAALASTGETICRPPAGTCTCREVTEYIWTTTGNGIRSRAQSSAVIIQRHEIRGRRFFYRMFFVSII